MKNYEILNKDEVTAVWNGHDLQVINDSLLPLFLKREPHVEKWLETRAIDPHRTNARLLKKALRLSEKDDVSTVLRANGVTVTDNYWIREAGSSLRYGDVRPDDSRFARAASNIALSGRYSSFNYVAGHQYLKTPELTLNGSYEKCWKMVDGKWWMFKRATNEEAFSEIFISRLCRLIGIDAAEYVRDNKCVRTLDFTNSAEVNFEPAVSYMGNNEDYCDNIRVLNEICPQATEGYVRMIFLDALIANPDRHTGNYGLLRDPDSGILTGFAPVFDHNMALISREYPRLPAKSDLLVTLFADAVRAFPEYRNSIPVVTKDVIKQAISETGGKARTKIVEEFVLQRYEIIRSAVSDLG